MRVDKEAFVKRWWSKYQENYALIESPVKRIEFLDRLLAQSKHVLFSDQIKSFIIEKREIARAERRQEEFVRKIHQSSILKSKETLSETSQSDIPKIDDSKKTSQDWADELVLQLKEVFRKNPNFTAEKIWRELKRETGRKNKNHEYKNVKAHRVNGLNITNSVVIKNYLNELFFLRVTRN